MTLHHDSAPAHSAIILREFLTKNSVNIVPQPPYSPDLVPYDFFLFSRLKNLLRGHHFESIEEIQWKSNKALKAIPRSAYEDWKNIGKNVLCRERTILKKTK